MKQEDLINAMLDFRAEHSISQGDFAKICKVTPQTICNIERGVQTPSKLTERKILNVINKKRKGD